jgi:RNA polymerase sigma-70 factor (ECF subfamily)
MFGTYVRSEWNTLKKQIKPIVNNDKRNSMSETISDIELLRRMRQGDKAAFTALYHRHHPAVYRYALLRCGSAASAADIVQEVFMGLLSDRYAYDVLKGELRFFLFGIARYIALKLDGVARHYVSPLDNQDDEFDEADDVVCEAPNPLERLLKNQLAEDLRQAIATLAPHYRDVLILFELQELSYLDIAQICQINVGTVRSRLSRARAALAEQLSDYRTQITRSA